jgi:sugar lactone lactonase YvrE
VVEYTLKRPRVRLTVGDREGNELVDLEVPQELPLRTVRLDLKGERMAGLAGAPGAGNAELWIMSSDGQMIERRQGVAGESGTRGSRPWSPAWSADGESVYYLKAAAGTGGGNLVRLHLKGGQHAEEEVTDGGGIIDFVLSPTEKYAAVVFSDEAAPARGLYPQSWYLWDLEGEGEPYQLTHHYGDLVFAPDGEHVAFQDVEDPTSSLYRASPLWTRPVHRGGERKRILPSRGRGSAGLFWTTNDRLLYWDVWGKELWSTKPDGSDPRRVFPAP